MHVAGHLSNYEGDLACLAVAAGMVLYFANIMVYHFDQLPELGLNASGLSLSTR